MVLLACFFLRENPFPKGHDRFHAYFFLTTFMVPVKVNVDIFQIRISKKVERAYFLFFPFLN